MSSVHGPLSTFLVVSFKKSRSFHPSKVKLRRTHHKTVTLESKAAHEFPYLSQFMLSMTSQSQSRHLSAKSRIPLDFDYQIREKNAYGIRDSRYGQIGFRILMRWSFTETNPKKMKDVEFQGYLTDWTGTLDLLTLHDCHAMRLLDITGKVVFFEWDIREKNITSIGVSYKNHELVATINGSEAHTYSWIEESNDKHDLQEILPRFLNVKSTKFPDSLGESLSTLANLLTSCEWLYDQIASESTKPGSLDESTKQLVRKVLAAVVRGLAPFEAIFVGSVLVAPAGSVHSTEWALCFKTQLHRLQTASEAVEFPDSDVLPLLLTDWSYIIEKIWKFDQAVVTKAERQIRTQGDGPVLEMIKRVRYPCQMDSSTLGSILKDATLDLLYYRGSKEVREVLRSNHDEELPKQGQASKAGSCFGTMENSCAAVFEKSFGPNSPAQKLTFSVPG